MKIEIESTGEVAVLDGVRCSIWKGTTAGGVPCYVFVTQIGVENDADNLRFAMEIDNMPEAKNIGTKDVTFFAVRPVT